MQHHVPRVYLKNFCNKAGSLSVWDKQTCRMFSTGVEVVCAENDFYTLEDTDDAYFWEQAYSRGIEPIMGELLPKVISRGNLLVSNGSCIISDTEKVKLAFTLVMQMLRGKQSREYERMLFEENLPEVLNNVKSKFNLSEEKQKELIQKFTDDKNYFKRIVMNLSLDRSRVSKYVDILVSRNFIFYRIQGKAEFISSDNPVMFINNTTGNARMFSNGLIYPSTDVYYPLSPKMLLLASHPDSWFGVLSKRDGCIFDLVASRETRFISTINRKQIEQCFRHAFAHSQDSLQNLIT